MDEFYEMRMIEIDKIKERVEQAWKEYVEQKFKELGHQLEILDQEILKMREMLGKGK